MNIYFSGIGGTALAPLANLALDAGHKVFGSDPNMNPTITELEKRGAGFNVDQSGNYLERVNLEHKIDWLVYTSAMPCDHPELIKAQGLGIKATKRDQFIPKFIEDNDFKLLAVAATHGKTTTTTMLIWLFKSLGIPASYLVGSTLPFGPAGKYEKGSKYFIYECDEYDKNFLHYHPDISLIPSIDHDHSDVYPTQTVYRAAFYQFFKQSKDVILWGDNLYPEFSNLDNLTVVDKINPNLELFGHNKANATLVVEAIKLLNRQGENIDLNKVIQILNATPQAGRRFERLAKGLISDYAHHPTEIKSTINLAKEFATKNNFNKVVIVYQPHQNVRQHQVHHLYPDAFKEADKIYWLPTYLAREDPSLATLTPIDLTKNIPQAITANLNDDLIESISSELSQNNLVVMMSAGTLDSFIRESRLVRQF